MKQITKRSNTFIFLAISLVIFGFSLLLSCGGRRVLNETTERTVTVKEFVRDTVLKTPADSSYYFAKLKCTEDGKVTVNKEVFQSGTKLSAPKVIIKDNYLLVDCKQKADSLFFQWKEKYITDNKNTIQVRQVAKPLTWWQTTQIWLGRIFILIILSAIIYVGINRYRQTL